MIEENLHDGHRKRLLDLVSGVGMDSISEIQALEFVLTMVIPRKDTNTIAHRLLEKFGSFSATLEASSASLAEIEGMGERSAKLLATFPTIFSYYKKNRIEKRYTMKRLNDAVEYFKVLLDDKQEEELYMVALNAKNEVIISNLLARGCIKSVGIATSTIAKFMADFKAASIFIGHNHPGGDSKPSEDDYIATEAIKRICFALGVRFMDHIIISERNVFSLGLNKYLEEKLC